MSLTVFRRYAIALLLTLLALSLGLLGAGSWGAAATYSFFLGAVMLSSWVSGMGPGLLSTLLGTVAADYYLLAPIHTLTFDLDRVVQLSAFVGIAVLISSLNDSRRRAIAALASAHAQLEHRVTERTAELASANETLRAEIERRTRSERNFRGLIDAAPDAILVIDNDGRIVKVNDETERMFGYPRDALLGRSVDLIVPDRFTQAHHGERGNDRQSPFPGAIAGELTARRADGSEVAVEIRTSPLETGGELATVAIVRDVTERRRAQREQQRLVHDLGERVKELIALHAAGRLLNEPASPADQLPRIVELLPPAWQYPEIASARICADAVDARTPGFALTSWVQRAEFPIGGTRTGVIEVAYHEPRPAAVEGPFLTEERNLLESLAAMLRAYFERLHGEEQRIELARAELARQRAQEDNAAKDQFLATLSHELRSPLNVMLGWIQMLRSEMNVESMTRGLNVLERSVRLQSKLIDDLLDVSRITAGKLRIDKRLVDLAAIASNAVDAARPAARGRNIALNALITPSLWMEADPHRLQQVIANLLTNALKFTPEHGSVEVRLDRVGDRAQVVVRDSGIGIRPDLLPRIFDRFQQGDSSTTGTHGGLGLGLAIVKHLVEQHEGQITAASEGPGYGSTFTVEFPLLDPEAAAHDPSTPDDANGPQLAGLRVLVVDDEPDARATLRALLERFGAEPTVVATAGEAFTAVCESPPDVLLSDIVMPGEDGYALLRRIRTTIDATRLPAAALSARADGESRGHAADAGFQEYLTKPVDAALLAQTLARLVHRGALPPTSSN